MGLNNMLPINLNFKKSFNMKGNKNLNFEKTDDFKEKINKYSAKDKYKKNDEKEVKNTDSKEYTVKDKNVKVKNINTTKDNDIKDSDSNIKNQDNNKIEDNNKEITTIGSISHNTEIDRNNQEVDIELYEDVKQELENIVAFLQTSNLQNMNDSSKTDELNNSLEKISEGISNNNLKLKDIEKLLKTLEEINLSEGSKEDYKSELLDEFKSFLQEKIDSNIQTNSKQDLDKTVNLVELSNETNKDDKTIKIDKKTQDNINEEDTISQDGNKNIASIKGQNESSQMNLFDHKDEELEKFEKEFLKISEKKDNEDANINLDNLNISKISQKIKGVMSTQKQSNNIDSKEILDQIVSKSKLSIDKDKSVMEIKLEPESLGKLTLKIAVERGIVTAKFTAENDKIKDIIENNMDELKNNLLAQGLNVQSLSVSVDSQGDLDRHKNILEAMAYNKKMSKNVNVDTIIEEEKENPYLTIEDNFNQLA